jgi:hypothetical protein
MSEDTVCLGFYCFAKFGQIEVRSKSIFRSLTPGPRSLIHPGP